MDIGHASNRFIPERLARTLQSDAVNFLAIESIEMRLGPNWRIETRSSRSLETYVNVFLTSINSHLQFSSDCLPNTRSTRHVPDLFQIRRVHLLLALRKIMTRCKQNRIDLTQQYFDGCIFTRKFVAQKRSLHVFREILSF